MSFSSFVCRSSRSFFVCVAFRVRFRSFRVSFEFDFSNSRSRILKSNFEFVFFASLLYSISRISIFDSNFEFKFLEFSCRISNSSFSLRCSIRFLEFRFESFVALFDFSNFDSKVSLLYSTSRISIRKFHCSIRLLEFRCSSRFLEFRCSIRLLDSSPLNFEFVLIYSTSRTLMIVKFSNCCSRSRILHLSS